MDVKENINLLLEGVDSVEGYQTELIRRIREEINIHNLICIEKDHDGKDHLGNDVISINYDMCEHNQYLDKYDLNDLLPLDKDILEAMRPYEEIAMRMLIRNTEQDVYFYDECRNYYLQHLRFWNHIFVKYKITHVFQVCVPHHVHDYIIYSLAKINHCKYRCNLASSFWNFWLPCTNLEKPSELLLNNYAILKEKNEDVALSETIEHYYQALQIDKANLDSQRLINGGGRTNKQTANSKKEIYEFYFSAKSEFKRRKHMLKERLIAIKDRDSIRGQQVKDIVRFNRSLKKRSKLRSKLMRDIKYYDSLAVEPITEPYVIYYLHYQPEATTLPQAGVFVEQELVISLLASTLKKMGIRLYVKEHFVQPCRSKRFYDALYKMDNVTLIKTYIDSKELLVKSVAAATCSGSAAQEAIVNNIPVLLFGLGIFCGAPGTFTCGSATDIESAIQTIQQGYTIKQKDVRLFFKAFDMTAVKTDIYVAAKKNKENLIEECGLVNLKNEIIDMLKN